SGGPPAVGAAGGVGASPARDLSRRDRARLAELELGIARRPVRLDEGALPAGGVRPAAARDAQGAVELSEARIARSAGVGRARGHDRGIGAELLRAGRTGDGE